MDINKLSEAITLCGSPYEVDRKHGESFFFQVNYTYVGKNRTRICTCSFENFM